jgi:hypothetical protein
VTPLRFILVWNCESAGVQPEPFSSASSEAHNPFNCVYRKQNYVYDNGNRSAGRAVPLPVADSFEAFRSELALSRNFLFDLENGTMVHSSRLFATL